MAEQAIPLDDLETTWQTLLAAASNYDHLNVTLIEACRLIEAEIRTLHGDEAWRRVTQGEGSG